MTRHLRDTALALAATLCAVVLAACTSPPPVHPLGAGCTWPADLNPGRDGLAVLIATRMGARDDVDEAVLYHVATDTIRARCSRIDVHDANNSVEKDNRSIYPVQMADQGVTFPPLSSDYRLAITLDGIVDLPTGHLTPPPDPRWRPVAMVGPTSVLRLDTHVPYRVDHAPTDFCLAARPDTPQDQCHPITDTTTRGGPIVTPDATVEWAPATAGVPLTLTDPTDGTTFTGIAQPATTRILTAYIEIGPPDRSMLRGGHYSDAYDRNTMLITRFADPTRGGDRSLPLRWYHIDTVTPQQVTGTLHTSTTTYQELTAPTCPEPGPLDPTYVIDDHTAVIVGCFVRTGDRSGDTRFIRVDKDGPLRLLGSVPVGTAPDTLPRNPTIYYWPPTGPATPRP